MKYNINNNNLSKVLLEIKKELENNYRIINELLEIDNKYCGIQFNLEYAKSLIERFRDSKVSPSSEEKIFLHYNGNPLITLNLSILAITTKRIMVLDCDKAMMGVNIFIVETINTILGKFETDKLIYLSDKEISDTNRIVCIDNINKYNLFLKKKISKLEFYSHDYMDFYRDSDEFDDITELIYQYAEQRKIPIESYSELELDQAIEMINNGLGTSVVILTNNEQTKKVFENNIKNKTLYINKNPFESEFKIIEKI